MRLSNEKDGWKEEAGAAESQRTEGLMSRANRKAYMLFILSWRTKSVRMSWELLMVKNCLWTHAH